jgi:hypothetical protein
VTLSRHDVPLELQRPPGGQFREGRQEPREPVGPFYYGEEPVYSQNFGREQQWEPRHNPDEEIVW